MKSDLNRINEDFSSDEETCFPEWFNIKSVVDIYKFILASIERNILFKFKDKITNHMPTTYTMNSRNAALDYFKSNENLLKEVFAYMKDLVKTYHLWFQNDK